MRDIVCVALLALSLACGCSSSNPPPAPDAADPLCNHAAALCVKINQCAPFLLKAIYGDLAGCTDRLTKVCTEQEKSEGSGMVANILACETALGASTCDDVFANNVPACAFRGTFVDGAACGDNSQCASAFCAHNGNLCGVCAAKGASGATCASGSNDECQSGLVCSSGNLCVAPAAVGAACNDSTAPCLIGSFCTLASTCGLTVPVGQECPGTYLNLGDGTVCLGKSSAASPQLSVQLGSAAAGQPCGLAPSNGLPATLCAPGSVAACKGLSGSIDLFGIPTNGLCAALIQDGFTCAASSACLAGAQCISGTCQIPSGRYCL
jgi:hypothetical protein